MNVVFFGLKRAFHGTLRLTRRALASLGLTAARFDLLYIVAKAGGTVLQRELQRALGVAAPTVSRMLASLEELGLIRRDVMEDDRRYRNVVVTKAGRRSVFRAARLFVHSGVVQLTIDSALSPDRWHDATICQLASGRFAHSLALLRLAYRDVATFDYPRINEEDEDDLEDRPRAGRTRADWSRG